MNFASILSEQIICATTNFISELSEKYNHSYEFTEAWVMKYCDLNYSFNIDNDGKSLVINITSKFKPVEEIINSPEDKWDKILDELVWEEMK